jgi:hypothetical protein
MEAAVYVFKVMLGVVLCAALCACQRSPGEVMEKVRYDFGMGEKPEGYVSGSERVMENLHDVADAEMKRMNFERRHGEVKFQEQPGFGGVYYKEVKVYEDYYVLDARPITRSTEGQRGYVGFIEYEYRIRQSERKNTRTDASAAPALINTDESGRETYRYRFSPGGAWDGEPGEKTRG